MNLRIYFLFIFFCYTLLGFGQSKISGKVIDATYGLPLSATQITSSNRKITIISGKDGTFEVDSIGFYIVEKKGYQSKVVEIKNNRYFIIQLAIHQLEFNEIIITANHLPKKLKKATASIGIISSNDIERSNNTDFAPIINRIPGVFMQNGALNTNRITIRGIGARNLFGTSKIRAYFKDIPLTNGSGETTLEDFELSSIARFEIIKGAVSSIYGAGLGGAIHISPQNSFLNETTLQSEIQMGSFGLQKQIINVNYGTTKNSFRAVFSNTHSDGYRENNQYDRQTFTVNSNHFLNDKIEVSVLASFVNLKAFIPSSINKTTFLTHPEFADAAWKQSQGFEDAIRGILGLTWSYNYSNNFQQTTSVFSSFRDAFEPRPFNILKENTFAFGARTRFLGKTQVNNKNLNWTVGAEFFNDIYKNATFQNLYQNFPPETGSVQGNILSDFKENRNYYNLFLETNYEFSDKTTLTIGINANQTWYHLKDRFPVSDTNIDQSGNFSFNHILSPKVGVSHLFLNDFTVFASVSQGFSPISLNETLLPNGQINTNLKPEIGWNFEIGTGGEIFNQKLQYLVSLYRLEIENLLVSRRTPENQFIGVNAGKTQHNGLELSVNYKWLQKEDINISSFVNFTKNDFIFKEFLDGDNNFSGNQLTGVPSHILNVGLDVNAINGLFGNINFQNVGAMPITDSNSLFSEDYSITNLKIGYKKNLDKKLKLTIFLGLNNIFDTKYASQILINASGFGGNAPRYYYPGNPINFFSGININYSI